MTTQNTTVACAQCGALNGAEFRNCIRCSRPLSGAAPADKALRRVPAPRRRVRERGGLSGELLLGRWPAEALPAAKFLVVLNLLVFLGQMASALAANPALRTVTSGGTAIDALRYGALPQIVSIYGTPMLGWLLIEPWRLLTACFVHIGPLHLLMNMLGLVYLARSAEPALGSVRFIIAYTACGVLGFAASVVWFILRPEPGITAGASGAIFGMMGMVLGYFLARRDNRWKSWLGGVVMMAMVLSLFMPEVNHVAHIAGLASGVAFGAIFASDRPSAMWQRVLAGLCVLAILGSLLAARLSTLIEQRPTSL